MAISKITPNKLVTDSDARLLPADAMSDAVNVSIAESGGGTLNVLKPHTGNFPILALSPSDKINDDQSVVAIGQVSDPQRGFIYFAVCRDSPNPIEAATQSAIYRYDVENDNYRLVLRDSRLNFAPELFVKMDVVNGDFTFNGTDDLSTLLYFTDNVNPPRKINVDRALLGQYSGDEWNYNVNVIKAAPVYQPTCYFSTDSTIKHNNFKKDVYQFATQVIYRDGEESAISPYSKLLIPQHLTLANNEEEEFVINDLSNNLAIIDLNLLDDLANANDVSQVRLLARNGNLGTFFIVDQFDPNLNKFASVFGQDNVEVYNSGNRQYKFYNETLGAFIPQQVVNKLYDNVPFVAQGQCVAGNRLMFSNYTEGRSNNPVRASITPVYKDRESTIFDIGGIDLNQYIVHLPDNSIQLNINSLFNDFGVVLVGAGNEFDFSFQFYPEPIPFFGGQFTGFSVQEIIENTENLDVLTDDGDSLTFYTPSTKSGQVSVELAFPGEINPISPPASSVVQSVSQSLTQQDLFAFINQIYLELNGSSISVIYSVPNAQLPGPIGYTTMGVPIEGGSDNASVYNMVVSVSGGQNPPLTPFDVGYQLQQIEVEWEFICSYDADQGFIILTPYVKKIKPIEYGTVTVIYGGLGVTYWPPSLFSETITFNQIQSQGMFPVNQIEGGGYNFGTFNASLNQVNANGFKTGSLHKLGVVYYDEYNRSAFVNDIGTAYADWYNSQSRLLPDINIPSPGFSSYNGENTFSGPVSFEINFPVNQQNSPPSWAKTYQIVYPGASSVLDFVQYTVGGAYLKRKGELEFGAGNTREIDTDSKRIYVSIDTLDKYRAEKSTFRDYSYTVGDKLRIVSWKSDGGDGAEDATLLEIYPSASDGSVIEFDVVGVELLDRTADNPIAFAKDGLYNDVGISSSADISDNHIGKFLVLECPRVIAGSVDDNGNQVKFGGFDWFDLANDINYGFKAGVTAEQYLYPDGTLPGDTGVHWYKDCLIEIYTPRPSLHDEFWYEIGETRPVVRATGIGPDGLPAIFPYFSHGDPFIVSSGDVHYRPVPCKANSRVDQGGGVFSWSLDKEDWNYSSRNVEANTVSDIIGEPMWDKGRAHIKFEGASTVRRFAQVTYSDYWSGESRYLPLSSFNATLANFYDFDKRYGAARYIAEYGNTGELICLQENKLSKTPINISIIQDASGAQNLALSTNVLNNTYYFVGDYGCGSQPSAVLIQDSDVYFVDDSRRRVLRFAGGQLVPISNKEVSSQIELAFDRWSESEFTTVGGRKVKKIVSGYDPENDVYYVTFYRPNSRTYSGLINAGLPDIYSGGRIGDSSTFSYSKEDGWWVSKHSFVPQIYSNQNDTMFSCSYVRNDSDGKFNNEDLLFFKHGVANPTCVYYLQSFDFMVEVVSNTSPSVVKTFDAVSFEGDDFIVAQTQGDGDGVASSDQEPVTQMNCVVSSNLNQQSALIRNFAYREGAYYSMVPMDISSNSVSYITPLGVGSSSNGSELVFKSKLSGISIPGGISVQALVGQFLVNLGTSDIPLTVASVDSLNQITLSDTITQDVEDVMIFMVGRSDIDGDPIRGHYAKIKLTKTSATSPFDLYAINAKVTTSQYGHGLQE
jgi:hypothetical protein